MIGTSLVVYPAASLLDFVADNVPKYVIDPNLPDVKERPNLFMYSEMASTGMKKVAEELKKKL